MILYNTTWYLPVGPHDSVEHHMVFTGGTTWYFTTPHGIYRWDHMKPQNLSSRPPNYEVKTRNDDISNTNRANRALDNDVTRVNVEAA
jgi:hypothetical protein